jgi:hypothetical protein
MATEAKTVIVTAASQGIGAGIANMNRTLPTSWKPTKAQLKAAHNKLVPDLAAKNLIVLFAGINAHYQPAALAQLFGDLRLWAIAQHGRH